jgi:hypothetical protein
MGNQEQERNKQFKNIDLENVQTGFSNQNKQPKKKNLLDYHYHYHYYCHCLLSSRVEYS